MSILFRGHVLAVLCLVALASAARAQETPYDFQPVTAPIQVTRGSLTIAKGQEAYVLSQSDTCRMAMNDWGWGACDTIDNFVVYPLPGVDSTLIEKPNSDGYVKLDDWASDERADVVAQIVDELTASSAAQSQALGQTITFEGWLVEPTLNLDKNYMYYASKFQWAGAPQINIKATVFDRRGYVVFSIIPVDQAINQAGVESLINATLDQYAPTQTEAYASFSTGDTVAAVGAVGVLAGLAGLQYGKGAAGGLIAAALLILKKAWFLLAMPIIWLKSKFSRRGGGGPGA